MTALPLRATGILRGAITEIDVAFGSLRLLGLERLLHASAPGGHVIDLDLGRAEVGAGLACCATIE